MSVNTFNGFVLPRDMDPKIEPSQSDWIHTAVRCTLSLPTWLQDMILNQIQSPLKMWIQFSHNGQKELEHIVSLFFGLSVILIVNTCTYAPCEDHFETLQSASWYTIFFYYLISFFFLLKVIIIIIIIIIIIYFI